jgi:hypothetical protein
MNEMANLAEKVGADINSGIFERDECSAYIGVL